MLASLSLPNDFDIKGRAFGLNACGSRFDYYQTKAYLRLVVLYATAERYPGAIEDAASAVPKSAARHLTRAIKALEQHLPATAASAWDILHAIALTG
jgi:hypothetical protein